MPRLVFPTQTPIAERGDPKGVSFTKRSRLVVYGFHPESSIEVFFQSRMKFWLMLRQSTVVSPPPNRLLQGQELASLPWWEGLGEGESPCDFFDDLVPCLVGLRREIRQIP